NARAIDFDLANARALTQALDLARDLEQARKLERARELAIASKLAYSRLQSPGAVRPSQDERFNWPDLFEARRLSRRIAKNAIGIIAEFDQRLVSNEMRRLRAFLDVIEAREEGRDEPKEGIRVIRERRSTPEKVS